MNFDSYISELLFEHDCVIIPGLGGFITNWAHASVHPVQHTFYPPSKKVSFNAGLNKNDGLLASFIAQQEQISYEETLEVIEDYVKECQLQLENKKTVFINLVGRLQKDYEGNIQFWPDEKINWLSESYGLTKFVSPPIKRERTYKKPEQLFADRKPTGQKKEGKRISKAVWLVLPALILAFWGFYNADLIRDIDTNYSGIGQFIKHSINERPELDFFPSETTIEFSLDECCNVKLQIYNISGKLVRTLYSGVLQSGIHSFIWDASNNVQNLVPCGIYFYQLEEDNSNKIGKMVFLK